MSSGRDLLVANILGLMVLLGALFIGWQEAAAFGLAVLVLLDLFVWLRGRQVRSEANEETEDDEARG